MKNSTKKITFIAMMAALSYILYFLEISVGFVIPTAPFLKIDLSDLPVIITSLKFDVFSGLFVDLIKNILHISISKDPSLSGEISNFFYCLTFILPLLKTKVFSMKNLLIKFLISIIFSTILMCFINYYITLPIYGIYNNKLSLILTAFIPFNLIKGILLTIISLSLSKRLIFK